MKVGDLIQKKYQLGDGRGPIGLIVDTGLWSRLSINHAALVMWTDEDAPCHHRKSWLEEYYEVIG